MKIIYLNITIEYYNVLRAKSKSDLLKCLFWNLLPPRSRFSFYFRRENWFSIKDSLAKQKLVCHIIWTWKDRASISTFLQFLEFQKACGWNLWKVHHVLLSDLKDYVLCFPLFNLFFFYIENFFVFCFVFLSSVECFSLNCVRANKTCRERMGEEHCSYGRSLCTIPQPWKAYKSVSRITPVPPWNCHGEEKGLEMKQKFSLME